MAEARLARCPHCHHDRETKAQPRTKLRCPNCGGHYLAPALVSTGEPIPADPAPPEGETPPAETPAPPAELLVATDEQMAEAGLLGPEVVKIDALSFPEAEVHPPAEIPGAGQTSPEASEAPPAEVPAEDAGAPIPAPPPTEPPPKVIASPSDPPGPVEDRPPRDRRRRQFARW